MGSYGSYVASTVAVAVMLFPPLAMVAVGAPSACEISQALLTVAIVIATAVRLTRLDMVEKLLPSAHQTLTTPARVLQA